jgi:hypothetical protein
MIEEIFTTHYIKKDSNGDVSMHGKPYADYPKWAYDYLVSQIGIPRNAWQPIETAPKDKYVLVFCESHGVCVSFYTQGIDTESDVIRDGWFSPGRDNRDEMMVLDGPVTHWMPLPEPPESVPFKTSEA